MWQSECEKEVNRQIRMEYQASYDYDLMSSYFDRNSVGLKNVARYFRKASDEERDHAHKLMEYQNKRGGKVVLGDLKGLPHDMISRESPLDVKDAFETAYKMEVTVYNSLLSLHKVGERNEDPQLTDFLEGEYLEEQIDAISELEKYISQLKLIGNDGHGVWEFNNRLE